MWSDNQTVVGRQFGEKTQQKPLIRWPGAARDDALASMDETLDFRERPRPLGNGSHTVEARVATHSDIVHAVGLEQLGRGLILHKEMGHIMELLAEP